MMQAREVTAGSQFLNPGSCLNGCNMITQSIPTQFPMANLSCSPLYSLHAAQPVQDLSPPSSYFSNNSTSDEAEEQMQQLSLINERKKRRMISNRESARRSRMRKQRHLDELWSQVVWVRNENRKLIEKLHHVSESHQRVVQENAQLREEASKLRQIFSDMQLCSPLSTFEDLEDGDCNTEFRCSAEDSSNPSTTNSSDTPLRNMQNS